MPAANLHKPSRLEVPDHGIERLGIARTEHAVLIAKFVSAMTSPLQRPQRFAVSEFLQQRGLGVEVPVYAGKRPRRGRVAEDVCGFVDRLVVMMGDNINAAQSSKPRTACRWARRTPAKRINGNAGTNRANAKQSRI